MKENLHVCFCSSRELFSAFNSLKFIKKENTKKTRAEEQDEEVESLVAFVMIA